jgi:transaldolase
MAKTLLEQLREMTTVVAGSGDVDSILRFRPQDSTTNSSLIAAAAKMAAYQAMHRINVMARKQLTQGIEGFS